MSTKPSIVVVAGEPSGDMIGAHAVRAIRKKVENVHLFGIGGDHLAQADVALSSHISQLTALGPTDSLKVLPRWLSAWAQLRRECENHRPRVALLVDCPDVNVPLARALKADGVKVLQYMGPKVWAWRKQRLALLKSRTDMVALGFHFEKQLYDQWGVPAVFVGHPLLDEPVYNNRDEVRQQLHVPRNAKVAALLPGSRKSELKHHSEVLIETGVRLLKDGVVPVFAPFSASEEILHKARSLGCIVWERPARELFGACDCALTASGTVTLELALAGVPMAILYKVDRVNYWAATKLLHIPYIGLPNWIAGKKIVPELLQDDVTPQILYDHAQRLLFTEEGAHQKDALANAY